MSPKLLGLAHSAAGALALSAAALTAQPAMAAQELTRAQVEQLCTNPDAFIKASGYTADCKIIIADRDTDRLL